MHAARRDRSRFERVYSIVVLVKGVDGAVELLLGLALLLVPASVQAVLTVVAEELGEGTSTIASGLAARVEQAGDGLSGGAVALALFLLVHGVVKLATVYCLLRRLIRFYPWAIAVLLVLLVVQASDAFISPMVGAWVLAVLDLAVLVLVTLEHQRLRRERAEDDGAKRTAARASR